MPTQQRLDPTRPGDKAKRLQAELRNKVVGQAEAIEQVVGLYQISRTERAWPAGRSFVLFEKASNALWNLLLGILDKAMLTLGDNRRADFSRAIIFMASNLGATEMEGILRPGLGFQVSQSATDGRGPSAEAAADRLQQAGLIAARRKFSPEFVNRSDAMVVFRPLEEAELSRILDLELARLQERISQSAQGGGFALALSA
jgi:ATP-dependent Clp protease ATP-binding subunit ClpA